GATAAALVDLSTVAGNKISNPPWVKFQSAGWVNFPSAPTAQYRDQPEPIADAFYREHPVGGQAFEHGGYLFLLWITSIVRL
ncbi:MAG: hypothetical protein KKD30_17125, partial [Gammaproteobacteria bacterium]|nr:hypothetical protein [Gammaproteobacteria bacterium]MBU0882973.1 hypothetical protein [Gammaproteobacteria bacterium]MBU1861669.1 hypothetical protein [Gammaproteobacteria bacterium]